MVGIRFSLLLIVPLFMLACGSTDIYNEYRESGPEGWHRDSVLTFDVPVTDTLCSCTMFLQLRHTGSYPYTNLWVAVELMSPDSIVISRDTMELILIDEKGNWKGSGSGQLLHLPWPYQQKVVFARTGNYKLTLSHCMSDSVLPDITHAGLRITNQNGEE